MLKWTGRDSNPPTSGEITRNNPSLFSVTTYNQGLHSRGEVHSASSGDVTRITFFLFNYWNVSSSSHPLGAIALRQEKNGEYSDFSDF